MQDLHSRQLSLSDTMHSWQHYRYSRVHLQSWILRRWRNMLSLQDVLAVRHESQHVLRQHFN